MNYEKIESYETACEALGIKPLGDEVFNAFPKAECENVKAYHKLTVITRAINEGWYPDFSNNREEKYEPYMFTNSAGLACANTSNAPSNASAHIGSRLCFRDYERATFAVNTFKDLYKAYFMPPKWEDEQERVVKKATAEKEAEDKEQNGGGFIREEDDFNDAPDFMKKVKDICKEHLEPLCEKEKDCGLILIAVKDNYEDKHGDEGCATTIAMTGGYKPLTKGLASFLTAKQDNVCEIVKGAILRARFKRVTMAFSQALRDFMDDLK